jgi:hypothetical protein
MRAPSERQRWAAAIQSSGLPVADVIAGQQVVEPGVLDRARIVTDPLPPVPMSAFGKIVPSRMTLAVGAGQDGVEQHADVVVLAARDLGVEVAAHQHGRQVVVAAMLSIML